MRSLAPRVALQLWIVVFIVFFGAEVVHLESSLRIATHVLFGVPLLIWAALRLRGPFDRVDLAAVALLAVFLVVALGSRDRTEALNAFGLATAYATLFVLLRREAAGALRTALVQAAAIGLVATLMFNAWLLIDEKIRLLRAVGGVPWEGVSVFPWESVNALPILVLLTVPTVAWMPSGIGRRALAAGLLGSAAIVVPLSVGRAGWLALGVMGVAYLLLSPKTWRGVLGWSPAIRWSAAVVVVVGLLGAIVLAVPRVFDILESSARLLIWEQALGMVSDRPWLGFGPGAYAWSRLEYAADGANLVAVRLVHSIPLQTLVDGGIVLLVGVAAATACWGLGLWQRRRSLTGSDRWAVAALLGLVSSMWLDDFSYLPATTVLVVGTTAFLVPVPPAVQPPASAGGRMGLLALLGIAWIVALPHVVGVDLARGHAQAARNEAVQGKWSDAAEDFERATRWHPENAGYWLGLGMARSHDGDLDGAVAAYRLARDAAPGDARAFAALSELTDDTAEQLDLLSAAADRTLGDPMYAVRLALAQEASGEIDRAIESWGRAVALDTRTLDLLRETAPGIDEERVAEAALEVIATGRRGEDATRWDIGLAIDRVPDDAGAAWQSIAAAQAADHARAGDLARSVIEGTPYSAVGYWALAAVAAFECDAKTAEWALRAEADARDAYVPLPEEPSIRREFVFREASLGPTQPAGTMGRDDPGRWPWYLVPMPAPCEP